MYHVKEDKILDHMATIYMDMIKNTTQYNISILVLVIEYQNLQLINNKLLNNKLVSNKLERLTRKYHI